MTIPPPWACRPGSRPLASGALLAVVLVASGCLAPGAHVPDVRTPPAVVHEMLRLAAVRPGDVVYDLGSGDGRIVIAAARAFGARGVGVEIDPALVETAERNARRAGVSGRVRFVRGDLLDLDLGEATVVTLYLGKDLNRRLRPRLEALRPGTRVVSHNYDMDDWPPTHVSRVESHEGLHHVYLWVIPERP